MTTRMRARDLGVKLGRFPIGEFNAITDVPGVRVGQTTLIAGEGQLEVGKGPVRTGVTVLFPHEGMVAQDPVFAGYHQLNGNGEMTGIAWVEESGLLTSPIGITNTHSVGMVRDSIIAWEAVHNVFDNEMSFGLPVVAETYDGRLNDINGFHVRQEHVFAALDSATAGAVAEGCVGGGTGMICHEFKGGIGTASRKVQAAGQQYNLGVLVQANYGDRPLFRVDGVPVGEDIGIDDTASAWGRTARPRQESGSIIVIIATDAPLLPHQCKRLAQRATIGIARMGGYGGNGSGDLFLAFSNGNRLVDPTGNHEPKIALNFPNEEISLLFEAAAETTEEAILNAICMATDMTGINDRVALAMPLDRFQAVMKQYGRL